MSRISLAFSAFFRLLTGRNLPPEAAAYLPSSEKAKQLPVPVPTPVAEKLVVSPSVRVESVRDDRKPSAGAQHRDGALALLALLQREGRLVDFLRESLDSFSDADIGAAARDVHRGCKKVLEQHLTFEPVMPGAEDDQVTIPTGFDPAEVRIVGETRGEPPFRGTLRHHGWRVTEATLPTLSEGIDRMVIAPAEVEMGS
jgi:Domain of unknown function (DUF2760)